MGGEITKVFARQVWDSRGRPTVEVEVELDSGARGRSIAPAGASTGRREALDRRDGGKALGGFGVRGAVGDVNAIVAPALRGHDALDQAGLDATLIALDGTPDKSRLGGNAIIACSCAAAWAAAAHRGVPLWRHLRALSNLPAAPTAIPLPMIQIFGGGKHASGRVDVQDFLVMCTAAKSFAEALEWTAEIYLAAASLMKQRGKVGGVADEGGLWPDFADNSEALDTLTRAIALAGFEPGRAVGIALDVAASSFQSDGRYRLSLEERELDAEALIAVIERWCADYPIISVEDPVGEDDDAGFAEITRRLGSRVQIVGDDYLTTNADSIRRAGAAHACNAVLLKANQCGTISELIAASAAARSFGWNAVQSGRSGESEDVTLPHLALGLGSDQIKVGSIVRSERNAKWNEMLRIEETVPEARLWSFTMPGTLADR